MKIISITKREVFLSAKNKRIEIIDCVTKQRWANEIFKTRDEAKSFCVQNNLIVNQLN